MSLTGGGRETAVRLLAAVGGNLEHLCSEVALAHLCGAAPIPASSGRLRRRSPHRRPAPEPGAVVTVTDYPARGHEGARSPSRKNLERIEQAYRTVRRENVARYLLAHFNREGRGTRVEIHPFNQSQVDRPRQCAVEFRTLNVRRWERIVEAWAAGDDQALDDAWVGEIADLGLQRGQCEYVTNVGFAA
ncbi:transposase [Streptomyces avermitilis]|uniref:transposase n=1 Tax=Streptomyces avermitilis TaxID=33903 RepID=UPI0036A79F44